MLIPALRQGSYVDPQIAKHIPFHHRTIHDTSLSYIRTFVQQLSLTQDIIANNHDVARYATSEWTPTLEDFRYDWTQPITSSLNAEAIRVIAVGILSDFTQGNYIETALDGAPTFPDLYQRVQSHFRYLRKKVKATKSRGGEGTEARAIAKRKVRLRHRCKAVRATHWIIVNHPSHVLCRNLCGGLILQTPSRRTGGSSSLSCRELAKIICPMRRVSAMWQEFPTLPFVLLPSAPISPRTSLMPWMY